jgi:hypothetical protein
MATKKITFSISKSTLILFSVIFILLLFFILYFLNSYRDKPKRTINKSNEDKVIIKTYIEETPQQIIQPTIINTKINKPEIPVYPKELPKYNNMEYQQVGILSANETDKEPIVLPLFGKKIYGRSDRWNYYTATDKNNMMRIPVKFENKDCEDEIGCNQIYDKDKLNIDIYQDKSFTATIYKNDVPKYFASPY